MNLEPLRELARDRLTGRTVIAITSGKGGVGKSTIASLMALIISRYGRTTLVDLDIHGTSIPRAMGVQGRVHEVSKEGIEPIRVLENLGIISIRGIIGSRYVVLPGEREGSVMEALLAFTNYGDSRFVMIDMPPGMSDELLVLGRVTNFMPIIVTTPSKQSLYVVEDLIRYLVDTKQQPRYLIVNMSYIQHGASIIRPFGDVSMAYELGKRYGLSIIELPIDPSLENYIGSIINYRGELLSRLEQIVREIIEK
jgi:ATP-binding protein involved in chromosome partitioning